jgi:hypothetical protein
MTRYKYTLGTKTAATKSIYGTGSTNFSTSGSTDTNTTTNWRVHMQSVEIMYKRETQYKTLDGTVDFNYLDCNYTIEAAREHIYLNASAGDMTQLQELDLISDSSAGALGTSGVIRTSIAGVTRREVRTGDTEVEVRRTGNVVCGKMPGAYTADFDVSANTNSTILDMLVTAKSNCPQFELNLIDL